MPIRSVLTCVTYIQCNNHKTISVLFMLFQNVQLTVQTSC